MTKLTIGRRSALGVGALSAAAILASLGKSRAQTKGQVKLVVLYKPQSDPAKFTKYYLEKHLPLVNRVPGVLHSDTATVAPPPPGAPPPAYWRISEVYFADGASLKSALATPLWKQVAADVANFADKDSFTGFVAVIGT